MQSNWTLRREGGGELVDDRYDESAHEPSDIRVDDRKILGAEDRCVPEHT
jgi:hypothetical protein